MTTIQLAARAATFLPAFSRAAFLPGAGLISPFFLLPPDRELTLRASGTGDDGGFEESSVLSPAGPGRVLLGARTFAVRDRAPTDGLAVEQTFDYCAQDSVGNVCYLGEAVTSHDHDAAGNLIGTDNRSAWLAGETGAPPGFIMPADPEPGFAYCQEVAAEADALDEALILAAGQRFTFTGITYDDVLVTFETSRLDPTLRG